MMLIVTLKYKYITGFFDERTSLVNSTLFHGKTCCVLFPIGTSLTNLQL